MQVYAQRTIGSDDHIGGLKVTIGSLFAEGTTNGMFCPSEFRVLIG
jgi:hypothetical protein